MEPGRAVADEFMILLPGLGRTPRCMCRLARRLELEGFAVLPWRYAGIRGDIRTHAARLRRDLPQIAARRNVRRIHFVTHSMGGIIVRAALAEGCGAEIGRIVMLAPPNRGSALARRLAPFLGWCIRPLADLSDDAGSFTCRLPDLQGIEVGVIAAARDGKVPVANTHLPGEADHIVVPGFHTLIMHRADVVEQVVMFLRQGRFGRRV